MQWKCFVIFLVTATLAAGNSDYGVDYDSSWWSDEASDDQLGVDQPADYAQAHDDQFDEQLYNEEETEEQLNESEEHELANSEQIDAKDEKTDFFKDIFENPNDEDRESINQFVSSNNDQSPDKISADDTVDQQFNNEQGTEEKRNESQEQELVKIKEIDANEEKTVFYKDLFENTNDEARESINQFVNSETDQSPDRLSSLNSQESDKDLDEADAQAIQPSVANDGISQESLHETDQETPESGILKDVENLSDYQIEDNRSQEQEQNKAHLLSNSDVVIESKDEFEVEDSYSKENLEAPALHIPEFKPLSEDENSPSKEDIETDEITNIELPENSKEILTELVKNKLGKTSEQEMDQFFEDVIENQQNEEIKTYIDETKSSSHENDEAVPYDIKGEVKHTEDEEAAVRGANINFEDDMTNWDENSDFGDLNDDDDTDIQKLVSDEDDNSFDEDTVDNVYKDLTADLEKLSEIGNKLVGNSESGPIAEDVAGYEEKYNKPYGEDTILSQRQENDNYENVSDEITESNLTDIFDTPFKLNSVVSDKENEKHVDIESDLETYQNEPKENEGTTTIKTINVKELNLPQYNDLMTQFAATHVDEIDTLREDYGKNVAPVHMTLTDTEILELTSPEYPNTYPTNNVIDWILEGEGTGIELNVTDLELRGVQGDFLLIKPGGADDTGHDGLVFSYHLNEPRQYRFTDVSRVFIRFQSGPGVAFLKGFRITVKMIWPQQSSDPAEVAPTPEPLLPSPPAVMSIPLGGVSKPEFMAIKEDFRRLIADMAARYIFANGITAGDNVTSEVTQITAISQCNVNWPQWESCVLVTFGVPLVVGDEGATRLDETDLTDMWEKYSGQDPFATRLQLMGITEFPVPDDDRILLTWLVLALGAVVSAVLLAFALWRYSCIEDYTRMKSYSDTDSVNSKRGLDLYPTPHQTLPPLYTESDYQWADEKYQDSARVDMGGFTNRQFVRDELLDIESDEEGVAARDRFTTDV